jgi:hypothetical protein
LKRPKPDDAPMSLIVINYALSRDAPLCFAAFTGTGV